MTAIVLAIVGFVLCLCLLSLLVLSMCRIAAEQDDAEGTR